MRNQQNARGALMQKINNYSFAMLEAALFLDTHPDNIEARAYYSAMRDAYMEFAGQYKMEYGPLHITDVNASTYWTWLDDPWPWEGGMC